MDVHYSKYTNDLTMRSCFGQIKLEVFKLNCYKNRKKVFFFLNLEGFCSFFLFIKLHDPETFFHRLINKWDQMISHQCSHRLFIIDQWFHIKGTMKVSMRITDWWIHHVISLYSHFSLMNAVNGC